MNLKISINHKNSRIQQLFKHICQLRQNQRITKQRLQGESDYTVDEDEMNELMMWSLEFRKQSSRMVMDDAHGLSSSPLALLELRGCPRGWRRSRLS
ncbi:hypothetical protein RchiOBHm_Chr7g0220801 [Rosa chinensis]|uniref:Uncharacterized protein n=1 Tax=Rosa chinensis TaxID=74649 RepID=A0A2P6PCW2_ROSCH|nr:hypothetical protein RchiOBHm_Chr7g0220801 [Rosa chinensis]